MEQYIEVWRGIDTKRRGFITTEDLFVFMRKQSYDEAALLKWRNLFDEERLGVISIEKYCGTLGIDTNDIWSDTRIRTKVSVGLPSEVSFISGDMALEWQIKIVEAVQDTLRETPKMSDAPKRIKATLDRLYGQLWHVVITQGQFWCHYGHEPAFSFVFQIEKKVFIIFKTPLA